MLSHLKTQNLVLLADTIRNNRLYKYIQSQWRQKEADLLLAFVESDRWFPPETSTCRSMIMKLSSVLHDSTWLMYRDNLATWRKMATFSDNQAECELPHTSAFDWLSWLQAAVRRVFMSCNYQKKKVKLWNNLEKIQRSQTSPQHEQLNRPLVLSDRQLC